MNPFKVNFNLTDYKEILPAIPDDYSLIINAEKDIADQFWSLQEIPDIITNEFIHQEATRLKQGVWILIKGVLMWIPPNYYQFLQYGTAGEGAPEFRIKRLKAVYHKIRVRKNPRFIGTYVIKNRQDGETTTTMNDALWEVNSGELDRGTIGLQSKTRDDVIDTCWFTLQTQWNGYPQFFKDLFYSHFVSGENIAQKLHFMQKPNPDIKNDRGKNVIIKYGPCVYNAFDGKSNMRRCILDEVNKWLVTQASFLKTFTNYEKFIMPGRSRRGLFDIISSPADTNGKHNDDAYQFWKDSDPNDIQENTGSTKTRIWRYYSNPLDGIEGFYDKYGDCDPEEIYEHIMAKRKVKPKDQLMEEIRGYPLPKKGTSDPDEEQLFGVYDTNNIWINTVGIKKRKQEILDQKALLNRYGNLVWPQNIPYSGVPIFVPSDNMTFNDDDARFCESYSTMKKIETTDIKTLPNLIQGVIGCDPYNSVHHARNKLTQSLGTAIGLMFRDYSDPKFIERPTLNYYARPWHKKIFFDDMVKMCIYTGFMLQYEDSDNDALTEYFRQEEMDHWMLDSRDGKLIETPNGFLPRKGDSPSGNGAKAFTNEIINLIDGYFSLPYNKDEPYLLDHWDFEEILSDILNFSRENTQHNHFTMAFGQCMIGKVKLLFQKKRKKDNINNEMINYVFS